MASSSRKDLSIEQKLEILESLKSKKPKDVANDFKVGYSTVRKIKQHEKEIRKIALSNGNLDRNEKNISKETVDSIQIWNFLCDSLSGALRIIEHIFDFPRLL